MQKQNKKNPVAKALGSPLFRKRIVKNKKTYTRKGRGSKPPAFNHLGLSTTKYFAFEGTILSATSKRLASCNRS
jgi:stalled ribosome alternative rescue factor ArfA